MIKTDEWESWWPSEIGAEMSESAERRAFPRYEAKGEVVLHYFDAFPRELEAGLVDVSRYGFRVQHDKCSLRAGQIVRFQRQQVCGEARVVWTRRSAEGCESGLAVLSQGTVH